MRWLERGKCGYPGEIGAWGELKHNASEMVREGVSRQCPYPESGIVDDRSSSADPFQDNKVIEVPMEDRGQFDLGQGVDFCPERPWGEMHLAGDVHQGP